MNQAMNLYSSHWDKTKKTEADRETLKSVCTCLAEEFEAQDGIGFKFGDGSQLIFTSDNVQVSLF
jgi:hypothetical protein